MSQFLPNITGTQRLQQTGRSPVAKATKPVLGDAAMFEAAEAGTALPPRVVILTALAVEFLAVADHVENRQEIEHPDGTVYEYGRFTAGDAVWDVAIVETGQGNRRAATETQRAIQHFKPDVVLFVGVAGGRKDVKIGDVVAAEKVYNYESGRDEIDFKPRPEIERSSYPLEQRARAIARDWLRQKQGNADLPTAYVGAIAAGESVVASTESGTAQRLNQNYGDALAVEKEGYGFLGAAREIQGNSALVIRGISDLLDNKENADQQGSQQLAARHASKFAFELLAKLGGSSASSGVPSGISEDAVELQGENFNLDLNRKLPETTAVLQFHQYEDSYSIRAFHSKVQTLEETADTLTLRKRLGQFGRLDSWSIETVGDLEDYQPKTCMIGKALKWLRYVQKEEPTFVCLVIEESQDSIVPWELLNLQQDKPLGVALQTVRSRLMVDDEMAENRQEIQAASCCCQGQALVYGPMNSPESIDSYFPVVQNHAYESFSHDEPEQMLIHLQQVEIAVGLVVVADVALQQVSGGRRTAYLRRTSLLQTASLVMLQLSVVGDSGMGEREVATAFLEHGARGVLGMLENIEGGMVRQVMNDFFTEHQNDTELPVPEILRRLRGAIAQRLNEQLTDEMSRLYLATFMYAYYGHPMAVLQLTPASS
jgi:nucleoside phosphorylase